MDPKTRKSKPLGSSPESAEKFDFDPKTFIEDPHVAFCAKNQERRVIFQNSRCQEICGQRTGVICTDGCMESYRFWKSLANPVEQNPKISAAHWNRKQKIGKDWFEIVYLKSKNLLITLLYSVPLPEAPEVDSMGVGFTQREEEVIGLMRRGYCNREIAKMLYISISTLKTHLNNIYRKSGPRCRKWIRPGSIHPLKK